MTALLLALLAFSYLHQYSWVYSSLIVVAVGGLALVESGFVQVPTRARETFRLTVITFVVLMLVVAPALFQIMQRRATAPYRFVHDGAIQTEEAIKYLLDGVNPYVASYSGTPMAGFEFSIFDVTVNPALEHNPYLPMTFLLPLPFYLILEGLTGWFDLRFFFLLLFLAMWLILPAFAAPANRNSLLVATALNPLFVPYFVEGRNDVVTLFFIALALLCMRRRAWTLSALMMGLSMTVKQTAWFLAPFYLLYLWWGPCGRRWGPRMVRALVAFVAPLIVVLAPFALWDWRAFLEDTILFQSAGYPVFGYGLSEILLQSGLVPARTAEFPFWVLQLAAGLPLLALLARRQSLANSPRTMLAAGTALTLAVAFFSRALQDNYIGYCATLGVWAYFAEMPGA